MNKLKELRLIVKMNERLGVETEQSVFDQIIKEEQKEQKQLALQEERKAVFKSTFADLSGQISKLMAEEKQKSAEEQALLDRFATVLAKIDDIKANAVSDEPQVTISEDAGQGQQVEDILEGIVEIPEVIEEAILAPIEEPSLAKEAAKKIKKKEQPPSMFVQPTPEVTGRDLKDIQQKLKLLEGWVGKISMTGPGGGAVWLRDLDDVARSSVLGAADGDVLTYNASTKKWIANPVTITANGIVGTLDQVTTAGNTTTNPITVGHIHADYVAINTSASYTVTTGQIAWNPADLTFDMGMANGVTLQVGQEQYIKVKAANTITNGQSVMFAGVDGEHILALPTNVNAPGFRAEYFIGIATQSISKNGFGYITTFGKVHNINTLAWTTGDILHVDPNVIGGLTNIEPESINIMVAAVTKRAGGDGHLMVRPTWRPYLDELNGVTITAPANGHVLMYISSSNTWVNHSIDGFQTSSSLANNVAALTSNNSLYLDGIAANQYANSSSISWTNSSPAPGDPFKTIISANNGSAAINLTSGMPGLGTVKTWTFDATKVTFPDSTIQYTAWTGSVATLTSNNTLYLGGVAANQYAYANVLSSYQTTAGLSANVAKLAANSAGYLSNVAANQYAYANGSNFSINNPVTITHAPATATGYALTTTGRDTQGGTGYFDFLRATNTTSGVTNGSKTFRLNSTGGIEIINSAYTGTSLSLSDSGNLAVAGTLAATGLYVNSKQAVNGPAFRAYPSTGQTITSGTLQKVNFGTETFDTNSNFASSRFTPTVEGYYQFNASIRLDGATGVGECMIVIFKNGNEYARGWNSSGTQFAGSFWSMSVSDIAYANGTGDYFEIYIQQTSGVSMLTSAYSNISYFSGSMIRGG